jgi:hypothetical protein
VQIRYLTDALKFGNWFENRSEKEKVCIVVGVEKGW